MMARIKRLWSKKPGVLIALVVALGAFVFFGAKTAAHARFWSASGQSELAIEGWMTPRYISLTYGIPPEVLFPALGLEHRPPHQRGEKPQGRITLEALAFVNDTSFDELRATIIELANDHKKEGKSD